MNATGESMPAKLRTQLDALADELREETWTIRRAARLLCGYLPNYDDPDGPDGIGAHLPGAADLFDQAGRDLFVRLHVRAMEARLARLLRAKTIEAAAEPRVILEKAVKAKPAIVLPWHAAAIADPKCERHLPRAMFDPTREDTRMQGRKDKSARAIAQHANSQLQRRLRWAGARAYCVERNKGFPGSLRLKNGRPNATAITDTVYTAIGKKDGNARSVLRRVNHWLKRDGFKK